jgi:POT family proton-dependent oligopeptide transporter
MITKLAPKGITGVVMGTWFLATAFAQYAASLIAQLTGVREGGSPASGLPKPAETVMVYGSVFGSIALVALAVGVLLVVVSPLISRRMHGVR